MKVNVKRSLKSKLLLATVLTMSTMLLSGVGLLNASATEGSEEVTITIDETTMIANEGFEMENGASVRIKTSEAGIRWSVNVSDEFQAYLTKTYPNDTPVYGTLVTSTNVLGANKTILDVVYENKAELLCSDLSGSLDNDVYTGAIILGGSNWAGLTDAQKATWSETELVARAYVKVGETVIYAKAGDVIRSMRGVAAQAIIDGENSSSLSQYVGTVTKSATESAGDYDITDEKGEIKVEGVADGDYTAYINARKIGEVTVSNETVTISNIDGLDVGVEYSLNLFDEQADIVATPFFSVTKVIKEAKDLAIFDLANRDYATLKDASNKNPTKNITGYYVLGGDIDASDYTMDTHGMINTTIGSTENIGFNGTFDGRGYTIKGLTFGTVSEISSNLDEIRGDTWNTASFNLFGIIGTKGTVKNFAMTDVKYNITRANLNAGMLAILATLIYDEATVENVYIDLAIVKGGAVGATMVSGLAYCLYDGATVKNVVIDTLVETGTGFTNVTQRTPLMGREEPNSNTENYTQLSNVYLISDKTVNAYAGVKLYASLAGMKDDGNNYDTFNSTYWDKTSGIPLWNGM